MRKFFQKHGFALLGIFFISFVLLLPFFFHPYIENDDTWFHLMNIGLIKNMIQENFWSGLFGKILPFVGNGLGYGTRLFYPPLAHTLGAYLSYGLEFLHLDILTSLKIFHFLILFGSGLTMYYSSYFFHRSRKLAFFSSVIYMASSYHMCEIYVRDSLGESLLFIFLPLIFVSISALLQNKKKIFYICFVLGYVGGILSHFTMMIYVTLILGASMLFYYKKVFRKEFLVPFLKACVIVLLLTAFFFEPMFEHKLFGHYMVYKDWYMSWGIWHTTLWGIEYFIDLSKNFVSYRFSLVVLGMMGYVLFKKRHEICSEKYLLITVFLGISFLMSIRLFFPWLFLPYLFFMIQFGWRLVLFVVFGVALLSPLALQSCKNRVVFLGIILCVIVSGMMLPSNERPDLDLNRINYAAIMGWQQEYLPEKIGANEENKIYFENRNQDILIHGDGEVQVFSNHVPNMVFEINTDSEVEIDFPRIFYFGYVLRSEDGRIIPVYENEHGLVTAIVDSGTYELRFDGSFGYRICLGISILTFCFLLVFGFFSIFRSRFQKISKVGGEIV